MSWIPVLATALGAVIGLGSGLLIDQVRSRRDDAQKSLAARRDAYVSYLSSLHDANEAMRAVSLGEYSPDLTRTAAARAAFRAAAVTQARERIILLAPQTVIAAADDAFRSLRALRDRIGQGEGLADYEPVLGEYAARLHALRDALRRDLGVKGSSPQIPL
jgi:hypothetical protein